MSNRGGLAVYVTSHGFGHLNRTAAVLNLIPEEIPLVVRCRSDLFAHWRERLTRPAALESHVSDSGALNPPGNSASTDGPGTIELAMRVHAEAMARIDRDIAALRDEGTAAVLCDAPAVPLIAAKKAGVPGFLLANFTWSDIYRSHAKKIGREAMRFVAELRAAYRMATLTFRAQPGLFLDAFTMRQDVGMVLTRGRERRAELRASLDLSDRDKVIYCYVGRYGQASLGWERLREMSGFHFVGFHAPPGEAAENFHVVRPIDWTGADLAVSADAMVVKAGYGTACEAMAARTPMIYPPRTGFAEHRALDQTLRMWGGGIPATTRQFESMRIESLLQRAVNLRPGPPPYPTDGAHRVARRLIATCQRAGKAGVSRRSRGAP